MSPITYIYNMSDLCEGDSVTIQHTEYDARVVGEVRDEGYARFVGPVRIWDYEGYTQEYTLVQASRPVTLPTRLWSVIADVECFSHTVTTYDRAILAPNEHGLPVWVGFSLNYASVEISADSILSFSPTAQRESDIPNSKEALSQCLKGDVLYASKSDGGLLVVQASDGVWEDQYKLGVYQDSALVAHSDITTWTRVRDPRN